jgi:fumarylacetoacetate (FAA) hydrolase
MKLVTYRTDGHDRGGILLGEAILDLGRAFAWWEHRNGRHRDEAHLHDRYGRGVLGFVQRAAEARPVADELCSLHAQGLVPGSFDGGALQVPLAEVELQAPIPRPPSMRDGYAFRQHVETARRNRGLEMIPEFDQFPVFYFTNHQSVIGPGDLTVMPLQLERLDFELEAAIVIGKEARNLSVGQADAAIFGMTIMNDFSARVLQIEEMKLSLGPAKGKDFATGLGPWLVTMDELAPKTLSGPAGAHFDLEMRARVNGKQVSKGNVKDMTWTFAQILERVSYGVTVHPGDVIGSGTCGTGCFLELNGSKVTDDQWLRPGDAVELDIDLLGTLAHKVRAGI